MPADTQRVESLSPWWKHTVILILIGGLAVLVWLTIRSYSHAPPIPDAVQGPDGATLFTREDIVAGQHVFLKYGLMDNGSIWGHGGYLGPDFSAAYLHNLVEDAQAFVIRSSDQLPPANSVPQLLKKKPLRPGHRQPPVHRAGSHLVQPPVYCLAGLLCQPGAQPRVAERIHFRCLGVEASDGILCLDGLGLGGEAPGNLGFLHQQFSIRSGSREHASRRVRSVERIEPGSASRRYRRGTLRVRQVSITLDGRAPENTCIRRCCRATSRRASWQPSNSSLW